MKGNGRCIETSPDGSEVTIRRRSGLKSTYWRRGVGYALMESQVKPDGTHVGTYKPMWNPNNGGC